MSSTLGTLAPPAPVDRDVDRDVRLLDPAGPAPVAEEEVDLADVLVEEVSIDGMCGVY